MKRLACYSVINFIAYYVVFGMNYLVTTVERMGQMCSISGRNVILDLLLGSGS